MFTKLPKLIRFLLSLALFEVTLFTLFRVAFFIAFSKYDDAHTLNEILYSFWLGFRFDVQLFAIAFLPILLFGGIKYIGLYKSIVAKYFWLFYIFLANLVIISVYIIDFPYYDFFKKMVDSSIIRYFYDIGEAMTMLKEGYPLVSTAIGTSLVLLVLFFLVKKIYDKVDARADLEFSKKQKVAIFGIFFLLYVFSGYGKFEFYPWRWSEAFYSSNKFLSYLASNPVIYLKNTLKNRDVKYNEAEVKKHYARVAEFLEVEPKDDNNLSIVRVFQHTMKRHSNQSSQILFLYLVSPLLMQEVVFRVILLTLRLL